MDLRSHGPALEPYSDLFLPSPRAAQNVVSKTRGPSVRSAATITPPSFRLNGKGQLGLFTLRAGMFAEGHLDTHLIFAAQETIRIERKT